MCLGDTSYFFNQYYANYCLYPLFPTPTQLSFQIISFCYIVHAMKIYFNRKYRTIGMIQCTSCSPQSCIIEYKHITNIPKLSFSLELLLQSQWLNPNPV